MTTAEREARSKRDVMIFGAFDFGLDESQEARARKLHDDSIVIDMLYWGPVTHRSFTPELEDELDQTFESHRNPFQLRRDLERLVVRESGPSGALGYKDLWDQSGVTAGSRGVTIETAVDVAHTFGYHQALFDRHDWLTKALTADDFRKAHRAGGHAAFVNTQHIGPDMLTQIDSAYGLGLRMLMPAYNVMNPFMSGCTERTDAGVSNQGHALVKRMNELGIIIDTAHVGKRSSLDCCELSSDPVIASHTSLQSVYAHDRGKDDEELKALAQTGGIIGIVTIPFFLGGATVASVIDHVEALCELVGWEHVGIGTDWPMHFSQKTNERIFSPRVLAGWGFRPEHNIAPSSTLEGFDDYRDFPNITRGMVARGFSDVEIRGILGENFIRVFERVCG